MENNKRCRGVRENNNNHKDDDEDEAEAKRSALNSSSNKMRTWHHPSSRIYRVSRASGGKDRHSKVYTSKGLRDRRVRLSVSTAIQFYDLQDRLGYDQPSKAIEWLIKAAHSAIDELPSLDANFPEPMDQNINVENHLMITDSVMDPDAEPGYNNNGDNTNNNNNNQQQHSSASETSKGSVLSLSRSEIRVKARERARERVKDKEKDRDDVHDQGLNTQGSFTKLLTGGSSTSDGAGHGSSSANFIQKQQMQHNYPPVSATADFFNAQSGFSSQGHFGMVPLMSNGGSGDNSNEMQPFAFMHDHFFPVATAPAEGDYNLNFSISPGFAGFHRGTLQSNSPSHQHHHHHQLQLSHHHNHSNHHQVPAQRLSLALHGSSMPVPLFFGTAANATAGSNNENQYSSGFDGHLQLDAYKNLELKGKEKS